MAGSISPINVQTQANVKQGEKTTRTSIFYVNDVHSNLNNIAKLKTAADTFDSFTPSKPTDKLKFSSGDIGVGRDPKFSKIGVVFQNASGIMASAAGNHEFDLKKGELVNVLKDSKYKLLGMNVDIPNTNEANNALSQKMIKSYVQEDNGNKYGVIGLMPFDFEFHLSDPEEYQDFHIKSIEKTVPEIQKQVDDFKKQGIDKIILLSHAGYQSDVALANSVEGLDVIMGGHTHDLLKGIQEGKNIFYSKKTGEPTIITQAGKNGDHFGVLNLEFDEKGVIKKAQNNVNDSNNFRKSSIMKFFTDQILGKPEIVGQVKYAPKHIHDLITENPGVNFLADAEREMIDADIAMINAGNIRACIEEGPITNRDLQIITPFDNKVWILKLSEKELVDAVKAGANSLTREDNTPGILQFSGLKYTISKSGELKSATYVDKSGQEAVIDVNNPSTTKTYKVAVDDFIAKGGNGYLKPNPKEVVQKFDFDKNKLIVDYLKKHPEPVVIKEDKRITIED